MRKIKSNALTTIGPAIEAFIDWHMPRLGIGWHASWTQRSDGKWVGADIISETKIVVKT